MKQFFTDICEGRRGRTVWVGQEPLGWGPLSLCLGRAVHAGWVGEHHHPLLSRPPCAGTWPRSPPGCCSASRSGTGPRSAACRWWRGRSSAPQSPAGRAGCGVRRGSGCCSLYVRAHGFQSRVQVLKCRACMRVGWARLLSACLPASVPHLFPHERLEVGVKQHPRGSAEPWMRTPTPGWGRGPLTRTRTRRARRWVRLSRAPTCGVVCSSMGVPEWSGGWPACSMRARTRACMRARCMRACAPIRACTRARMRVRMQTRVHDDEGRNAPPHAQACVRTASMRARGCRSPARARQLLLLLSPNVLQCGHNQHVGWEYEYAFSLATLPTPALTQTHSHTHCILPCLRTAPLRTHTICSPSTPFTWRCAPPAPPPGPARTASARCSARARQSWSPPGAPPAHRAALGGVAAEGAGGTRDGTRAPGDAAELFSRWLECRVMCRPM